MPIALAAWLSSVVPGLAQEPAGISEVYGAWQLRCETPAGGRICEIGQAIQIQGQAQPILQVAIGRRAKDQPYNLVIRVPITVWLPAGVSFVLPGDKPTVTAQFKRCLPTACIAEAPANEDLIAALRTKDGQEARIIFFSTETQPVRLPVSLKGVGDAFAAMTDTETKR